MTSDCERWHPGKEPRFAMHNCGTLLADGTRKARKVCLECKRMEAKERRDKVLLLPAYGVIPLNWPAPQLDL